jgi:hypothetical protein
VLCSVLSGLCKWLVAKEITVNLLVKSEILFFQIVVVIFYSLITYKNRVTCRNACSCVEYKQMHGVLVGVQRRQGMICAVSSRAWFN